MIHPDTIRAITLDLDDTLWPIAPTMARAEAALHQYLREHAPATAVLCYQQGGLARIRQQLQQEWHDRLHDLSALRRETIRRALLEVGDNPDLAAPAFDLFFEARQQVDLYEDTLEALSFLAARYPVVALSNGNADVNRVGLGEHFHAAVSAQEFGVSKPDPRIFHEAASLAGVRVSEVLHIGDDAHLDVQGARAAGMQCAWLNRDEQTWPAGSEPPLTLTSLRDLFHHLPA
jgi:putative hydrolase of the HAD superfamily